MVALCNIHVSACFGHVDFTLFGSFSPRVFTQRECISGGIRALNISVSLLFSHSMYVDLRYQIQFVNQQGDCVSVL